MRAEQLVPIIYGLAGLGEVWVWTVAIIYTCRLVTYARVNDHELWKRPSGLRRLQIIGAALTLLWFIFSLNTCADTQLEDHRRAARSMIVVALISIPLLFVAMLWVSNNAGRLRAQ